MRAPKVPRQLFDTYLKSLELDESQLDGLALEHGWRRREPRKITPASLLLALCIESIQGETSFNDIASTIDRLLEKPDAAAGSGEGSPAARGPSKQAVAKRMDRSFRSVVEELLARMMQAKLRCADYHDEFAPLLSGFTRILIQDSTIVRLPSWLFGTFSGVSNGNSTVSNARIQAVFDLKSMQFLTFSIDGYDKTDQDAADELEIRPGDLVLRDRGYLNFTEIARHIDSGADFVYRHKAGGIYHDAESGGKIDLLSLLKKLNRLDIKVLLNDAPRTRVRLVAAPVDEKTAAERRRKLKKESHGKNPKAETLELCGWTIFLTTLPAGKASFGALLAVYGLRWRIEIIFKAWKSSMSFARIHRVSEDELHILLKVRLLLITQGTSMLYARCLRVVRTHCGKDLSLQKFLKRLSRDPNLFGLIEEGLESDDRDHEAWHYLSRYCCYDKRQRKNFNQKCRGEGDESLS